VDVAWLQVPEDVRRVRAPAMAGLLTAATKKRVSKGDALALVLDLWAWCLAQVDEGAPDLKAELERCTLLQRERAAGILTLATEWPTKHVDALLQAMADPMVRVLVPDAAGWRVPGLADRYLSLSVDRADARGRARAHNLAKAHGWKSEPGNRWVHLQTGEVVDGWRPLLQRLEAKP
jgi:hypothetical protein